VLYKSLGNIDALEIRRTLLRNFPDDEYVGVAEYFRKAKADYEARTKNPTQDWTKFMDTEERAKK
jgi:hypothetical protein